jgi:hypothetical protein
MHQVLIDLNCQLELEARFKEERLKKILRDHFPEGISWIERVKEVMKCVKKGETKPLDDISWIKIMEDYFGSPKSTPKWVKKVMKGVKKGEKYSLIEIMDNLNSPESPPKWVKEVMKSFKEGETNPREGISLIEIMNNYNSDSPESAPPKFDWVKEVMEGVKNGVTTKALAKAVNTTNPLCQIALLFDTVLFDTISNLLEFLPRAVSNSIKCVK